MRAVPGTTDGESDKGRFYVRECGQLAYWSDRTESAEGEEAMNSGEDRLGASLGDESCDKWH